MPKVNLDAKGKYFVSKYKSSGASIFSSSMSPTKFKDKSKYFLNFR